MTTTLNEDQLHFALSFHTAFRKSLESKASAIVWNALHLMKSEDVDEFYRSIWMNEGLPFRERVLQACRKGEPARTLLAIGIEMMDAFDWESLEYSLANYYLPSEMAHNLGLETEEN